MNCNVHRGKNRIKKITIRFLDCVAVIGGRRYTLEVGQEMTSPLSGKIISCVDQDGLPVIGRFIVG